LLQLLLSSGSGDDNDAERLTIRGRGSEHHRLEDFSELLLSPRTNLDVIRALEDYGKELARRGASERERAAGTTIYYAAIASALAFHWNKVTQHSCGELQKASEDLEQKNWIPYELKDLLKKAKAACQERKA